MRWPWAAMLVLLAPAIAIAQTQIDQTRRIVAGRVIMGSDITAAQELQLVSPSLKTSDEVQVALENRLLKLAEIGTTALANPTPEEVTAFRQDWERSLGFGDSVPVRLARVHMSDAELIAWLTDDARIQKFQRNRFGRDPNPVAAVARWTQDLRKRAGLK
jgi:hypothetical protein